MPYVIEPSAGVDRCFLTILCDAYEEEVKPNGETRTVLHLHPRLAPVQVGVFPLVKKDGMPERRAGDLRATCSQLFRGRLRRERHGRQSATAGWTRSARPTASPWTARRSRTAPSPCATATRWSRSAWPEDRSSPSSPRRSAPGPARRRGVSARRRPPGWPPCCSPCPRRRAARGAPPRPRARARPAGGRRRRPSQGMRRRDRRGRARRARRATRRALRALAPQVTEHGPRACSRPRMPHDLRAATWSASSKGAPRSATASRAGSRAAEGTDDAGVLRRVRRAGRGVLGAGWTPTRASPPSDPSERRSAPGPRAPPGPRASAGPAARAAVPSSS